MVKLVSKLSYREVPRARSEGGSAESSNRAATGKSAVTLDDDSRLATDTIRGGRGELARGEMGIQGFVASPREFVDGEVLRKFGRFRDFDVKQLRWISVQHPVYRAPNGKILLEAGSVGDWNLYLLDGAVWLIASSGGRCEVAAGTESAGNAIAALKPRIFSVVAKTPVRFLWIDERIVASCPSEPVLDEIGCAHSEKPRLLVEYR